MTENVSSVEIERMEDMRYLAMMTKDLETLDHLLHERMLHVHATGNRHTKSAYLKGLRDGDFTYHQIDRSYQQIIQSGTTALVFNHLFLRLNLMGKNIELRNRALTVWTYENGAWQMLAMQSSAEPPAAS
jgi:hypothetical protein